MTISADHFLYIRGMTLMKYQKHREKELDIFPLVYTVGSLKVHQDRSQILVSAFISATKDL